jgi:arabinogalactan endo-1,4-beta-galactosidase
VEYYKIKIVFVLLLFVIVKALPQPVITKNQNSGFKFIKGVDISTLKQVEDNNGVFKENNISRDPIQIFKSHGINFIRLKLWHTPENGYNNLANVLAVAQNVKNLGLKFLLDIHFSDTWADPAHQTKPADWNSLPFQSLKDSVYNYTKYVITTLKNNGALPDMVQIGNEITCGMLWDDGNVCGNFNTQVQWSNFTALLNEGIRGVKESLQSNDSLKIMIHIDSGGDVSGSQWFFDKLNSYGVDFDIIGLSYYPWWQGTLIDLQNNLNNLIQLYNKEIIIAETAYPWTLNWNDNTNNIVGNTNQLLPNYPASIEGQKKFLIDLMNIINDLPDDKGLGIFYWEPEWISTQTFGSPWENLALFDFNGNLLNSISAFDSIATNVDDTENIIQQFYLFQNYPNPFNPSTQISWRSAVSGWQTLTIYDVLGNEISTLVNEYRAAGNYKFDFNLGQNSNLKLASGIYYYQLKVGSYIKTKKMILLK